MATYNVNIGTGSTLNATVREKHIYGASRLGMWTNSDTDGNLVVSGVVQSLPSAPYIHKIGKKRFEIANHLGNVNVVISDKKLGAYGSYTADVYQEADYYPFGMVMPGRKANFGNYRYGFNGMESDNEVKGDGNTYDYGARVYDPRIGRWMSTDPLRGAYPGLSPYNFAGNTPISAKDPDGRWIIFVNGYIHGTRSDPNSRISSGKAYWTKLGKDEKLLRNSDGSYATHDNNGNETNYFAFEEAAKDFFNDEETTFVNGSGDRPGSTADERKQAGREYAEMVVEQYRQALESMGPDEKIEIITHSMGAAFAEGMIEYFEENAKDLSNRITTVVHLSPADAADIDEAANTEHIFRAEFMLSDDKTLFWADFWTAEKNRIIPKVDVFGLMIWDAWKHHPKAAKWNTSQGNDPDFRLNSHADTKTDPRVFTEWLPQLMQAAGSVGKGFDGSYTNGKESFSRIKVETPTCEESCDDK